MVNTDTSVPRIQIHTSDRALYKRCRRKWNWSSQMRSGLVQQTGVASRPLWFGSGFHYAMEDFFGYRKHKTLIGAFLYYVSKFDEEDRPPSWEEDVDLAEGMFEHFQNWSRNREKFSTVWVDGRPLVELEFHVPLPAELVGRENVFYSGTIDRVVQDEFGLVWLLDYKTAKEFDTAKLEMDPQVSAYAWAAKEIFDLDVEGMIYWQFKKAYPKPPKMLKSGKFSLNKAQGTSYYLFKQALNQLYGGNEDAWRKETEYVEFLTYLAQLEQVEGDKYIRLDKVGRTPQHLENVYEQIIMEAREMVDPNTQIYPNPTKDCVWDCSFRAPCMALDAGDDFSYLLDENYKQERIEDRNTSYREKEKWDEPTIQI